MAENSIEVEAGVANKRSISNNLVLTVEQLKNIFLFGVQMDDDDGNEFPKEMFEFYILSAQQWLEAQLGGLKLCETTFTEKHDYRFSEYVQYNFIKLFKFPVQDVNSVAVQFPLADNALEFDPSWYRFESVGAHGNLFPTQGTFSSIVLSQGGSYIPLIYTGLLFLAINLIDG